MGEKKEGGEGCHRTTKNINNRKTFTWKPNINAKRSQFFFFAWKKEGKVEGKRKKHHLVTTKPFFFIKFQFQRLI